MTSEKNQQAGSPIPLPKEQKQGIDPNEFTLYKNLFLTVVVVLLVMVAQLVTEAWNNKNQSYAILLQQVNQQNIQLQKINDLIETEESGPVENRLEFLYNKYPGLKSE